MTGGPPSGEIPASTAVSPDSVSAGGETATLPPSSTDAPPERPRPSPATRRSDGLSWSPLVGARPGSSAPGVGGLFGRGSADGVATAPPGRALLPEPTAVPTGRSWLPPALGGGPSSSVRVRVAPREEVLPPPGAAVVVSTARFLSVALMFPDATPGARFPGEACLLPSADGDSEATPRSTASGRGRRSPLAASSGIGISSAPATRAISPRDPRSSELSGFSDERVPLRGAVRRCRGPQGSRHELRLFQSVAGAAGRRPKRSTATRAGPTGCLRPDASCESSSPPFVVCLCLLRSRGQRNRAPQIVKSLARGSRPPSGDGVGTRLLPTCVDTQRR